MGGSILINAEQINNETIITFEDTGYGIPPESMPFLFTKFYRVPGSEKYAIGTGLGLSISKRIIDIHGGTIRVDSKPNVSTQVEIRLPNRPH